MGDVRPLTNRDKEAIAQSLAGHKETVYEQSRVEIELEDQLAAVRKDWAEKINEAKAELRVAVETPHDGSTEQRAAICDEVVMRWQYLDELVAGRADAVSELKDDLKAAKERRRQAHDSGNQLELQLG